MPQAHGCCKRLCSEVSAARAAQPCWPGLLSGHCFGRNTLLSRHGGHLGAPQVRGMGGRMAVRKDRRRKQQEVRQASPAVPGGKGGGGGGERSVLHDVRTVSRARGCGLCPVCPPSGLAVLWASLLRRLDALYETCPITTTTHPHAHSGALLTRRYTPEYLDALPSCYCCRSTRRCRTPLTAHRR